MLNFKQAYQDHGGSGNGQQRKSTINKAFFTMKFVKLFKRKVTIKRSLHNTLPQGVEIKVSQSLKLFAKLEKGV